MAVFAICDPREGCILRCSGPRLCPLCWLEWRRHLPRKRLAWHAVQQGICTWVRSSVAAFKYVSGERAGIAMGLAESPCSRAPGSECTWTWEGPRNILFSQWCTKPDPSPKLSPPWCPISFPYIHQSQSHIPDRQASNSGVAYTWTSFGFPRGYLFYSWGSHSVIN